MNAGGKVPLLYQPADTTVPIPGAVRANEIIHNTWAHQYEDESLPDLKNLQF